MGYCLVGGDAIAAPFSAEDGEAIVKVAMEKFGAIHVLIANAGILRDKSFLAMSTQEWDSVIDVHVKGTFLVSSRLVLQTNLSPNS